MEPKRQRTLYELASIVTALVAIGFGGAGMLVAGLDDGPGSAGFLICALFVALGVGRLLVGLWRGNEGAEQPQVRPSPDARSRPRSRRHPRR